MRAGRIGVLIALAGLLAAGGARGDSLAVDDCWRFEVIPYLWAPRIDGTLNFTTAAGSQPTVSVEPINYLDNLNVPIMIAGEARKGAWSIFTDFVYVDFSGEKAQVKDVSGPGGALEFPVDAGSTVGLQGTLWSLGGGYTAWSGSRVSLELLGGFRYFHLETSLDWRITAGTGLLASSGSLSETADLWDGIVGFRGRLELGAHWFAPYYADVGSGSNDLSFQVAGGIAYAFSWGDVRLVYRDLNFYAGDSDLLERLRLTGPALGLGIRF